MIKIGCCGTAGLSLKEYSKRFRLMEVQSTFYRLPKAETAYGWRDDVPEGFEFTMKAFQGITHPADSPTWRKARKELEDVDPSQVGMLKKSRFVLNSWERSQEIAKALRASIIVIQLPPSFEYNQNNIDRIRDFFLSIDITCKPAIEFRHKSWLNKLENVKEFLSRWNVIIVTDPLKFEISEQEIQYHRMHGIDGFTNYKHRYSDNELKILAKKLSGNEVYVLFNNISMREDAERLRKLLEDKSK